MCSVFQKPLRLFCALILLSALISGCGRTSAVPQSAPFVPAADGSNYLNPILRNLSVDELPQAAASLTPHQNVWAVPSVPTWMTKIGDTWFLVDCYHNQIIYSDAPDAPDRPLTEWQVMTTDATQPHTIAGDGTVWLADDTENNRVLVFERMDGKFLNTQTFWNIGDRPHYTVYDENTDTFYVWSSRTGELWLFRRAAGTTDVYATEIRSIERLRDIYIRSFTIVDDRIYFVSGIPSAARPDYVPAILCCDLTTLEILSEYPVPDAFAGMTQLTPLPGSGWIISVSTDAAGSQDAASLIRVKNLDDLATGNWKDLYSRYFIGGGTPYYISRVENDWFLTEHRLENHAVWRFHIDRKDNITDVEALY